MIDHNTVFGFILIFGSLCLQQSLNSTLQREGTIWKDWVWVNLPKLVKHALIISISMELGNTGY